MSSPPPPEDAAIPFDPDWTLAPAVPIEAEQVIDALGGDGR